MRTYGDPLLNSSDLATSLAPEYQLKNTIGSGAFGTVYEASKQDGSRVAIKVGATPLIQREYDVLRDLNHHHLPKAHDHRDLGTCSALIMDYIPGEPILDWSRPKEPAQSSSTPRRNLPIAFGYKMQEEGVSAFQYCGDERARELLVVCKHIASALGVIHESGRLHLDLQPNNILVTEGPSATVIDLGLALQQDVQILPDRLVGSAAYMAPELGIGKAVPASDLYSLGIVLFECVTGQLPFSGGGGEMLVRKQSIEAPLLSEVLEDVPDWLIRACSSLLRRDHRARNLPDLPK